MDWNSFVRGPDPKVEAELAKPTKEKLREVQNSFERYRTPLTFYNWIIADNNRFTSELTPSNYDYWLRSENLSLRLIEGYLRWYHERHHFRYQSAFLTMVRFWRMWVRQETERPLPIELSRKLTHVSLNYTYRLIYRNTLANFFS